MTKIKLLPFFLLLLQLGACSSDDDRIYGTWVEPFSDSEPLIFRKNGTLNWFGEEGTFEHEHGWTSGRPWRDGQSPSLPSRYKEWIVTLVANEKTFVMGFTIDDYPNHKIQVYSDLDQDIPELYKESELELFMPEPFEKLGEGWGFPENKGGYNPLNIHSSEPLRVEVDGWSRDPNDYKTPYIYNSLYNKWEEVENWEEENRGLIFGNELRLRASVPEAVFGGINENDGEGTQYSASLDNGATWKALPVLYGMGNPYLTGTTVLTNIEQDLWALDAASESPVWSLRKSGGGLSSQSFVSPDNGIIVIEKGDENYEISMDYGVTWSGLDSACGYWLNSHDNGVFCRPGGGGDLHWYDATTHAWTTHEGLFSNWFGGVTTDGIITSDESTDGAYIRRDSQQGHQIVKWKPDGTENTLVTIPRVEDTKSIHILDDQIIVNRFGIWRMWR